VDRLAAFASLPRSFFDFNLLAGNKKRGAIQKVAPDLFWKLLAFVVAFHFLIGGKIRPDT